MSFDGIDYSLNNVQMEKICDCGVFTYTELSKCNRLEELFTKNGREYSRVVICYLTRANYGHWCCLYKNKLNNKPQIGFFDSYGLKPDDELDWNIDEYFRKIAGEDYPHLTWLLYDYTLRTGSGINYNQFKFQSKDKIYESGQEKTVATCGRWVIVRLALKFLSDVEYRNIILDIFTKCKQQKIASTLDQMVVLLTNPALALVQ